MRRSLPESPRWYEIRGDLDRADEETTKIEQAACAQLNLSELPEPEPVEVAPTRKVRVREIFEPPYGRRSLMLWIFQFFQTVGYYGFGTLAPLVLAAKGYKIVDTLGFTALIYLGYPIGSAVVGPDHGALRAQAPDRRLVAGDGRSGHHVRVRPGAVADRRPPASC